VASGDGPAMEMPGIKDTSLVPTTTTNKSFINSEKKTFIKVDHPKYKVEHRRLLTPICLEA
jgi:hypothetical protein